MPRILVADDDMLIRRFLQQALELGGYDVIAVADGAEAIAVIDGGGSLDAVVTDYAMPQADGLGVISHARRVNPTLPCIIVTAFRDLDLAMQGMQAGAVGFIPKPFKAGHLLTVVGRAVELRELAAETLRLRMLAPMLERFTMVLSNTLESKDFSTKHHSERLVNFADAIAQAMGRPSEERTSIRLGACLHDIGKVGIPEYLLRKAQRLTDAEFDVMRQHPEIGAAILKDIDAWEDVREIVRHHHEQYDGTGYPQGLRGGEIPFGARVVGVVDAFDVMRAGRPYAEPKSIEVITHELRRLRGHQFDPEIVDVFLAIVEAADLSLFDRYQTVDSADGRPSWLDPLSSGASAGAVSA